MKKLLRSLVLLSALAFVAPAWAQDDAARAQSREILERIIAFDTSTDGQQNPQMADYLAGLFRAGGFAAEDVRVIPVETTAALVVRYRGDGTGGRPILWLAHMDVVTARRSDWERDPFTLVEENGYFFGRGVYDNKAGVANMTAAFLLLKAEGFTPTRDLILVFSGDEETSGNSTKNLLENYRALIDAEFAINSDSGGGVLAEESGAPVAYYMQTAEKTFASFTLTARNPGGHSSQPRPDNAIYDLMDAVQRVRAYEFPVMWNDTTIASLRASADGAEDELGAAMRRFAQRPGDRRAAAALSANPSIIGQVRTTCVATMLQAGHADNALPQSATATVNCRIFPGVAIADVQAQLQRLAGESIEIAVMDEYASSDASPLRDDVMQAARRAIHARYPDMQIIPTMGAGATDGVFYRSAGIPTYALSEIFIKRSDNFAHGLNERIPVEQFYAGLSHWRTLIVALAGRE